MFLSVCVCLCLRLVVRDCLRMLDAAGSLYCFMTWSGGQWWVGSFAASKCDTVYLFFRSAIVRSGTCIQSFSSVDRWVCVYASRALLQIYYVPQAHTQTIFVSPQKRNTPSSVPTAKANIKTLSIVCLEFISRFCTQCVVSELASKRVRAFAIQSRNRVVSHMPMCLRVYVWLSERRHFYFSSFARHWKQNGVQNYTYWIRDQIH